MFSGQRLAVLCDDLHRAFPWDEKNETGRFLFGTGFPEPTVA